MIEIVVERYHTYFMIVIYIVMMIDRVSFIGFTTLFSVLDKLK